MALRYTDQLAQRMIPQAPAPVKPQPTFQPSLRPPMLAPPQTVMPQRSAVPLAAPQLAPTVQPPSPGGSPIPAWMQPLIQRQTAPAPPPGVGTRLPSGGTVSPNLTPGWAQPPGGVPGQGPNAPYQFDPNNPFSAPNPNKPFENYQQMLGWLMRQFGMGGGFGQQGDPRITQMLRQQAIEDAGARGRASRLALEGRSDVDPSTFGFQSLMSDLLGQSDISQAMNQATLQQALGAQDFYRRLFGQALGADFGRDQYLANIAAQDRANNQGFDWGSLGSGLGSLAGGLGNLGWKPFR